MKTILAFIIAIFITVCVYKLASKRNVTAVKLSTNSITLDFTNAASMILNLTDDVTYPAFEGIISNGQSLNVISPDGILRTITASNGDRCVLLWPDGTQETTLNRHPDGSYTWKAK